MINENINIEKVISYLQSKDVQVFFGPGEYTRYSHGDSIVYIDSNMGKEEILYLLLHELGHFEIMSKLGFDINKIADYYPGYFDEEGYMKVEQDFASKMARVHEELDAWRVGLRMSNTLEIDLDVGKYMKVMDSNLKTYIDYAKE